MMIEELGHHLAVCSLVELERMLKMDARFCNVGSIREPYIPRPQCLRYARTFHEAIFDDLERIDPQAATVPPRPERVAAILKFVDTHPAVSQCSFTVWAGFLVLLPLHWRS